MNKWLSIFFSISTVLVLTFIACKYTRLGYALISVLFIAAGIGGLLSGSVGGSGSRWTMGPTTDPIAVYGVSTLMILGGLYLGYHFMIYPKKTKTVEPVDSAKPTPPGTSAAEQPRVPGSGAG